MAEQRLGMTSAAPPDWLRKLRGEISELDSWKDLAHIFDAEVERRLNEIGVTLLSHLPPADADAVLHDVELSMGASPAMRKFHLEAGAVLDRFLSHAGSASLDPPAAMAEMCARGAADICVRDREAMIAAAQAAAVAEGGSYGTRGIRAEFTNPRESRGGAGAGFDARGNKRGNRDLRRAWRARGVAGRGGALRSLLCAEIGPVLRAPLYRSILADPDTAHAFSDAAATRSHASLSRLLSRDDAAIARSVDRAIAEGRHVLGGCPAVTSHGGAGVASAKRALSYVDANVVRVTESHAYIAVGIACALGSVTDQGATSPPRPCTAAEAAECLVAMLLRPRPRSTVLVGGLARAPGDNDGKATVKFVGTVEKAITAADPELAEHLTATLASRESRGYAEELTMMMATEIERLYVGWLPMETVMFAWDQWLLCGERVLAASFAAVVLHLRDALLRCRGPSAVAECLHTHGERLGQIALREGVGFLMQADLEKLSAQGPSFRSYIESSAGPPEVRPQPPPILASRCADIANPSLGWRERARGGVKHWMDDEEQGRTMIPRTIWDQGDGVITTAVNGYQRKTKDEIAQLRPKRRLAGTRIGRLFFWIHAWVKYLAMVRKRRLDRAMGNAWPRAVVVDQAIVKTITESDFRYTGVRGGSRLRDKLAASAEAWSQARDDDGTAQGEWGAMQITDGKRSLIEPAAHNLRHHAHDKGDLGRPGERIGMYARPELYHGEVEQQLAAGAPPEPAPRVRFDSSVTGGEATAGGANPTGSKSIAASRGKRRGGSGLKTGISASEIASSSNNNDFNDSNAFNDEAEHRADGRYGNNDVAAVPSRDKREFGISAGDGAQTAGNRGIDDSDHHHMGGGTVDFGRPFQGAGAAASTRTVRVTVEEVTLNLALPGGIDPQEDTVIDVTDAALDLSENVEALRRSGLFTPRSAAVGPREAEPDTTPRRMATLRHNLANAISQALPGLEDDRRVPRLTLRIAQLKKGTKVKISMRAVGDPSAPGAPARAAREVERAIARAGLSPRPDKQAKMVAGLLEFSGKAM